MLSLVEDRYNQLGWRDEGSHAEKRTRVIILSLACRNGHKVSFNIKQTRGIITHLSKRLF